MKKKESSTISHLTCIKSSSGSFLFSRKTCDAQPLPLQIVGTLNNIFTYGDNYGLSIHSLESTQLKIVWKTFHASITLILVVQQLEPYDESIYFHKLDLLFDAIVFVYGLHDLTNIQAEEKFKREIEMAFPLIDYILESSCSSKIDLFGGYLTNSIDSLLMKDCSLFQNALNQTCEAMNFSYACLLYNGRLIVATSSWRSLKPTEIYLISLLTLLAGESATYRDVPIFLPHHSSNQQLRLVSFKLNVNNCVLCFLCDDKPIGDFLDKIQDIWQQPVYDALVGLKHYSPRNLPPHLRVDQNLIAFLLISKKTKTCTSSLCPNDNLSSNIPIDETKFRYEMLKHCYLNISSNFFRKYKKYKPLHCYNHDEDEDENELTRVSEAYVLIAEVKCYALNDRLFEFYALFNRNIPVHALREVTKACFNVLMNL